jgi:hypothetical protein
VSGIPPPVRVLSHPLLRKVKQMAVPTPALRPHAGNPARERATAWLNDEPLTTDAGASSRWIPTTTATSSDSAPHPTATRVRLPGHHHTAEGSRP